DGATRDLEAARAEVGDSPAFRDLASAIQERRRSAELKALGMRVRTSFARGDVSGAGKQLEAARPALSQEPEWQALWREWELRQSYETNLEMAGKAFQERDFEHAQEILKDCLPNAPDDRARRLFAEVSEKQKDEAARKERQQIIARGRDEARGLLQRGD